MHWTFQEYQSQPAWFIDLIMPTLDVEQKVEEIKADNAAKKRERGH
jgi:hypothetical protein